MSCEKWCAQVTMAPIRVENIPNTAEYLLVPLSKQSFHPVAATFWFLSREICSSCSWPWCEWNLTEWTLFILTSLIQYVFEIHFYCCIHLFSLSFLLSSIPFYECHNLLIHPPIDGHLEPPCPRVWLLWMKLLQTILYKS